MVFLHASADSIDGIAGDHLLGAAALLLVPLVAAWFHRRPGWIAADGRRQLVVVLLAAIGLVHLGLALSHLAAEQGTGLLFLANGLAFGVLSVLTLSWRWWRPVAALLLGVTILAYGLFVISGRESVDDLGAVTELIELFAVGLVIMPRRRGAVRWTVSTASVLLITFAVSVLAWGGIVRDHAGALLQPPSRLPTAADRVAAAGFANATWSNISRFQDVRIALAAGYRPQTPEATTIHYENRAYERGNRPVLDPSRPQGLVYASTPRGPVLLGAMFVLGGRDERGYDFHGAVTSWHLHPNACVSPVSLTLSGLLTPYGACPPLSFAIITTPMLHVWRPDMPNGQFGELDDSWVKRIIRGEA